MSVAPATIGHYTIGREIGRGGMGIVYLARDQRLERDVAIKALPEDLALDEDRLARFEREARTLAALNHPNVAQIYGIEKQDGRQFLVLEYVEGETLEDRLDHGALPVDEAIEIGVEICRGLEAAHDAGVVHRDLKPGNVKLTPDGKVKVLDFGLAKAGETGVSRSDLGNSPTLTSPARHSPTIPGAILGTAPYMSPEQARGRSVDKRTDIWSFGVVLYEMLTGIGPFTGETVTDSIGAILHKDVDLGLLPPDTPQSVRYVLRRCLDRDRSRRLHDIADVRIELQDAEPGDTTRFATDRPRGPRAVIAVIAVATVAVGAALVGRTMAPSRNEVQSPLFMELVSPQDTTLVFLGDLAGPAKVSPDGRMVVFLARDEDGVSRLWLRSLTSPDARVLPGTERATFPFWSPDSESIAFFIENKLRRMDLGTGSTYTVCEAQAGRGGTWTPDGEILFSPGFRAALLRVDADGGRPSVLTELDTTLHTSHRWPFALPDGRHFVFSAVHHDPERQESATLMLGSLDGAAPRPLIRSEYRAEVVDDTLLFMREGTLMAARLDVERAELAGDPTPIVRAVSEDPSTWHAGFSASPTGVLVYHRSHAEQQGTLGSTVTATGAESNVVLIYDRGGRVTRTIAERVPQISMTLSPRGDMLAITAKGQGQDDFDLWLYPTGFSVDASTGLREPAGAGEGIYSIQPTRLASEPGVEVSAIWSPDGTQIAYGRVWGEGAHLGLFQRTIGGGDERLILAEDDPFQRQVWPTDWTPDGKWLVFTSGSWIAGVEGDVMLVPSNGGEPTPLASGPAVEDNGVVSPDGRWLAYVSDESSVSEVYVIPFAPAWPDRQIDPAAPSPRWRVSLAGGWGPVWSSDGTELYYGSAEGEIVSVRTDITGDLFRSDAGTPLFRAGWEAGSSWEVREDGQRFFITGIMHREDAPISVVLNWKNLLD